MVTYTRIKCTAQMIQECLVPLYLFLTIVFHWMAFFGSLVLSLSNQENNFVSPCGPAVQLETYLGYIGCIIEELLLDI